MFVYDKTNLNIATDPNYILVVYPIYDTRKDSFPGGKNFIDSIPKIDKTILSRSNTTFDIENFEPIDLVEIINKNLIK